MRIAKNVEMLEMTVPGKHYPVLLWDERDVVLLDTGYPGQFEQLSSEIGRCGFKPEQITKVILTHQDIDHIGNAKILRGLGAEIMAHKEEAPYIQGDKKFTKVADMEANIEKLPPERLSFYNTLKASLPDLYLHVDTMLSDGQKIQACGGMEVVYTPGHTPGHITLLLCDSKIIVCGDAANIKDGKLSGSNFAFTHDAAAAERSVIKILSLDVSGYVCYHGGYLAR
jgi:glyoxylase-like metal-dependent hydrolase (beta-lactamase superfamily II)